MRPIYTAIIHVREPLVPAVRATIEPLLGVNRGVRTVNFEPKEALITVEFDRDLTGLADIVRAIEDVGSTVSGVAQRRTGGLMAG